MSEMNNNPNNKIKEIIPRLWIKECRRDSYLIFVFSIFLIIIVGYDLLYYSKSFIRQIGEIFILSMLLCWSIVHIPILHFEPLILFENGIMPYETKFKVKILGKRNFIHFNKIKKITFNSPDNVWYCLTIELKTKKEINRYIDKREETELILKTFNDYNRKISPEYKRRYNYLYEKIK